MSILVVFIHKLIGCVLIGFVILGCEKGVFEQKTLAPSQSFHESSQEFQKQKGVINSKLFLKKHGLSALSKKLKLFDDKSFPKELIGSYTVFRYIINGELVENEGASPLMYFTKTSSASVGSGSNLISIKVNYFKYVTALTCICNNESFVIWLFANNKMVLVGNDTDKEYFMFLKKNL